MSDVETPENHYVLIIHGTWNGPEQEKIKWYQLASDEPDTFASKLNAQLSQGPLGDAVWKKVGPDSLDTFFSWSGDNTHAARIDAAALLAKHLMRIAARDARACIHLVAHSHGGNVVLKAIDLYYRQLLADASVIYEQTYLALEREAPETALRNVLARGLRARYKQVDEDVLNLRFELHQPGLDELRRWHGSTRGNETYRRLGGTLKAMEAAETLLMSSRSHRIGRIVTLGTPFVRKRWVRPAGRLGRLKDTLFAVLPLVPFCFGLWYLLFLCASTIVHLLLAGRAAFDWSVLALGGWATVAVLVLTILTVAFLAFDEILPKADSNLYFEEYTGGVKELGRRHGLNQEIEKIEILSISADRLDEAQLALSVEPVTDAYLQPVIRGLVGDRPRPKPHETGFREVSTAVQAARRIYRSVAQRLVAIAMFPARRILAMWTERYVTRVMHRLFSAVAFGMAPEDVDRAFMTVEKRADVPSIFTERTWDVTKILVEVPLVQPEAARRDYSFIWDAAELDRKSERSDMWKRVSHYLAGLPEREKAAFRSLSDDDVKKTCLVIEERLAETLAAVQLTHSSYYASAPVIEGVARYLETGTLGEREGHCRGRVQQVAG